jgi:predicted MFS family arabinose efflux permease
MLASQLSPFLRRKGIHYAWIVLALTFLSMLISAASLGIPGVLLAPLGKEYGWNTAEISTALAVRFVLFGLMGPFAAILIQRYGVRTIVCSALTLIAAGLGCATLATHLWHLVIFWGLILGVGSGMIALVLGAIVSTRWFEHRRGLIVGVLTASSATGQLIFLPVAAWLVEHFGWRYALIPLGAGCLAIALLVYLFMAEHPEDVEQHAYGAKPAILTGSAAPTSRPSLLQPFTNLRSVLNNSSFWILFATFFICGLSTNGLIQTHFISFCGDNGLTAVPAAGVLAMMGAFDFIGTIGSGWLSDRVDSRKLLFWYYGLRGLSLLWLPHSNFTLAGLTTFAIFYGLDWVATVPPTVRLSGVAFGKDRAPMIFGWIFAAHQAGAAVAAFGAGYSRTLLLTYAPAIYAAGIACLIAAAAAMFLKGTRPQASSTLQRA